MIPTPAPINPSLTPFLAWCLEIAMIIHLAAFFLCVLRLLRGPTLPDRVVALDLFGVLAVAFIALFAMWDGQPVFLDAAIALALVAFLGTVACSRFIELRGGQSGRGALIPPPLPDSASQTRSDNGTE